MKTFAVFLCLIATTADAAPLYPTCEGKGYDVRDSSDAEPVTQSIKVDGTNVWVEGDYLMPILSDDGDVWTFGSETTTRVTYGTLNRITGHVEISFSIKLKNGRFLDSHFEGVCRKAEKLF
jgi:hypothetical protein